MSDTVYAVASCRLCGGDGLHGVVSLARTPIGDKFLRDADEAREWEEHAVDLMLCPECGQLQLSEVIEPREVYDDYLYTTSVSHGLPAHFRDAATHYLESLALRPGDLVVEIGSNQGVMLRAFADAGMSVQGVDPAIDIAEEASASGIPTMGVFFNREIARKIVDERGRPKLVVANNVIANIPDLDEVAAAIADLLSEDGVFVMETSYALDVVQRHLVDTIYHEHLSYLSAGPLARFFERHDLELFDAQRIATKGGAIRAYVARRGVRPRSQRLEGILEYERSSGLHSVETYRLFEQGLAQLKLRIQEWMADRVGAGEKVVVYGASVGCVMMLYQFGLVDSVDYLIDDNPSKVGRYCPGAALPVFPSEKVNEDDINSVLVLAWRFIEPISKRHSSYLSRGGVFHLVDLPILTLTEFANES